MVPLTHLGESKVAVNRQEVSSKLTESGPACKRCFVKNYLLLLLLLPLLQKQQQEG